MDFLKAFFRSKPVVVLLLFLFGVVVLSRDPDVAKAGWFMPWDEIVKRVPGLPKAPETQAPTTSTNTNAFLLNPSLPADVKTLALDAFFTVLDKSNERPLARVMHLGDSSIWGENVAHRLRARFTKAFGNGGRGLVPPAFAMADYKLRGYDQAFSGNWGIERLVNMPEKTAALGLSLRRFTAGFGGSTASWTFHAGEVNTRFTLLAEPGAAHALKLTFADNTSFSTNLAATGVGYPALVAPRAVKRIDLASPAGAVLDGLVAENARGVSYWTIVRMGVSAHAFANLERARFLAQLRAFPPDLVVLQFGKNESGWAPYLVKHKAGMRLFIRLVREAVPRCAVLMIGPAGRLDTEGGKRELMAGIRRIGKEQRELAREEGVAFFDSVAALGGDNAFERLAREGHVLSDFIHLSESGGNLLADAAWKELSAAYDGYRKRQGQAEGLLAQFREQKDTTGAPVAPAASPVTFSTVAYIMFLLAMFFLYWLLWRQRALRLFLLLAASLYFYMTWNPVFVVLLLFSVTVDWTCGYLIYVARLAKRPSLANLWLALSLVANLGLLFFFKYFNLFAGLVNDLQGAGPAGFLALALPVGISFYTFQSMTYTIDIWRGTLTPIRSWPRYALFVSFFPQLVAGPIVRARLLIPQLLRFPRFDDRMVLHGMLLIVIGLFKKVVLSDAISVNFVDRVFASPGMYSGLENVLAVWGYALQIYCDFSGYSDIAIGSAAMLGFRLPDNFRSPYQSRNLQEFWHRWHITLSSWLRDYLYIPLGGSRKGRFRTYANLSVTMLLGGLWHGAAWKFVLWGGLHGAGLAVVRLFQRWRGEQRVPTWWGRLIGWFVTFQFVSFCWIFFRAKDMDTAGTMLSQIGSLTFSIPNVTLAIAAVFLVGYTIHMVPERAYAKWRGFMMDLPAPVLAALGLAAAVLFYKTATSAVVPFIYFQF